MIKGVTILSKFVSFKEGEERTILKEKHPARSTPSLTNFPRHWAVWNYTEDGISETNQ